MKHSAASHQDQALAGRQEDGVIGPDGVGQDPARVNAQSPAKRGFDASATMLNQLIYWPQEPEYQQAAQQRAAGQRRPMPVLVAVVAVLLGAVSVWAVLALRTPTPQAAEARALLEEEISSRTVSNEQLRATNEQLDQEIQGLEAAAPVLDPQAAAQADSLAVASGTAAVKGPGLIVTLDDAEAYKQDPLSADPNLKVRDVDLQVVVNGLWSAGAEAMTVNEVRVGAQTSIRAAGETILVDVTPITPPYEISAIGDGARLETGLARGSSGRRLSLLKENYSIPVKISQSDDIEMSGDAIPSLQFASAVGDKGEQK